MTEWSKENYDSSFTRYCFSFTPFCGSVGWDAIWDKHGALKLNQQIQKLVEMEYAIQTVPLWAQQLARQIDELPPCGSGFQQAVEAICTNIGSQDCHRTNTIKCFSAGEAG